MQLAQIEILGGSPADGGLADDVALLPVALDATRETLRAYLGGLFRSSAFQRGLIVRGIYFSGAAAAEDASSAPRACYLGDLLDAKIFPERGLAQTDASAFLQRSRYARFYQVATFAATLILGVGMWFGYSKLSRRADTLKPFFQQVQSDLSRSVSSTGGEGVRLRAQYLLTGMARLDFSRFDSVFLPSSWRYVDPILERFNRHLEGALVTAYDEIIFKAMHSELEERADLYCTSPPILVSHTDSSSRQPVPPLTALPSFRGWEVRTAELSLLEQNVDRYQRLDSHRREAQDSGSLQRGRADLESFGDLVDYLFGFRPPPSFFVDAALYERALDRVTLRSFRMEDYRASTSVMVRDLASDFRHELFEENPLMVSLSALEADLAQTIGTVGTGPDENFRIWRRLLLRLEEVEFILGQPQILWAFGSQPALGEAYEDLLYEMARLISLAPGLTREISDDIDGGWQWHHERLLSLESRYTGPFLAREAGIPVSRLSDQTLQLRDALQMLLGQSFMSDGPQEWFRLSIPPGERLDWDVARLEQANGLMAPYEAFRASGLDLFPPDLRPEVSRMVRSQTAARMIDLARQAQEFVAFQEPASSVDAERLLRFEVSSLSGAGPSLNRLLGDLQTLGGFEAYWDLSALLVLQGENALRSVDELLQAALLYQPQGGDFSWWQGESPVSFPAFGVRDQAGLATYLRRQRSRIDQLAAQYANPTMTAVGVSRADESTGYRELAEGWRAIIEQLGAYQNQTPGNSLATLENLIAQGMTPIGPDDCRSSQLAMASVDDFFLERANALGTELLRRCEDLAGERAAVRYGELEALFLQSLSGRFPFAEIGTRTTYPGVRPGDLRSFFALYDIYAASILAVPASNPNFDGTGEAAHAFLKRLAEVRSFFAFFLATPEPQAVPRYDFDVIFRVDREAERGGNQIIDWRLDAGEQRFFAPNGSGRWTYGEDEIGLELRWAQDSPRVPYLSEPADHVKVGDRVVTYRHDDAWSLLRFMLERRGPVPEPNPHTLSFEIRTEPSEATADQAPVDPVASESPTVVFLRLRLKTPDAKNPQPVVLPPCFPIYAPVLGSSPTTDGCVARAAADAASMPAAASDDSSSASSTGVEGDSGDAEAAQEQETDAGEVEASEGSAS